jgi:hypothetical protein
VKAAGNRSTDPAKMRNVFETGLTAQFVQNFINLQKVRFAVDSPLEQSGFEPLVPLTLDGTKATEKG